METDIVLEDVEIGEDQPDISAKRCKVEQVRIEPVVKNDKEIGKKLVLVVAHPDVKDRKIEISSAKYQQKNQLKTSGLWVKLDNNNKLPFRSATANLLRHLGKSTIKQLAGVEVDTVTDEQGYLAVKAY